MSYRMHFWKSSFSTMRIRRSRTAGPSNTTWVDGTSGASNSRSSSSVERTVCSRRAPMRFWLGNLVSAYP